MADRLDPSAELPCRREKCVKDSGQLLEILNRVVPIFLNVPDDEMFNEVLKVLLDVTKSRHGFFAYIDEDGSMVAPSMTWEIWDQCQIPNKTFVFPRETWGGMWGRSMVEKRSLLSNGEHHVPEGHIAIGCSMCVPLLYHGELIGLLAVANRSDDYGECDLELMSAIASFVSPVLHARLGRDRMEHERQRSEEALKLANKKLNLLSGVTRHDALNQLSIVLGYASAAKEHVINEKVAGYLDRIVSSGEAIQSQLEFTRAYQSVGETRPEWQNARLVFDDATSKLDMGSIVVENRLRDVNVYADMMFSRILYNLVENTIRHGGNVSRISVFDEESENGLMIVLEDDGCGIPDAEKAVIFNQGYGKHTGYGLFISREVLDLTGISIRERGVSGKGARFEIFVPKTGFRASSG
ncbi:MAG: GAF domain-containing sensor histidine kinase [Thermoplasmata archaeon]|nr:GAF domain-containing sensor histidine kinase [Thermoplasmata archaeon]